MNDAIKEDVTGFLGYIEGHVEHARDELAKFDRAIHDRYELRREVDRLSARLRELADRDAAIAALVADDVRAALTSTPESEQ